MTHHHFSASDYERMIAVGILTEDVRAELIAGEIVKMSPVSDRHIQVVNRLGHLLYTAAGESLTVSVQNPIRLGEHDEPQPDLALLRGVGRGIADAADILLVIEVADLSQEYDRRIKLPRYAMARIAEAWLIDTVAETVIRYTEPHRGYYRVATLAIHSDTPASTVLPALTIPVDLVLGPPEQ